MSEIRIQNLCHKKSILVNIYRQSLLRHLIQVTSYSLTPLIFEGSSALTISHFANLPLCLRHQNQIHIKSILMQPSSGRARPDQCKCRNDVGNRDLQHQVFHGKPQTRICHYTIEVSRCWDFTFSQGVHLILYDINKNILKGGKCWKSASLQRCYSSSKWAKILYIHRNFSRVCPPSQDGVENREKVYNQPVTRQSAIIFIKN